MLNGVYWYSAVLTFFDCHQYLFPHSYLWRSPFPACLLVVDLTEKVVLEDLGLAPLSFHFSHTWGWFLRLDWTWWVNWHVLSIYFQRIWHTLWGMAPAFKWAYWALLAQVQRMAESQKIQEDEFFERLKDLQFQVSGQLLTQKRRSVLAKKRGCL